MVILGRGKHRWAYEPPIPVERHRGDLSPDPDLQIEQLLWVPAVLVSRLCGQYPGLRSEADELFSVGVVAITEAVRAEKWEGSKLKAVAHVRARRAMEYHASCLGSVIRVGKTTLWKSRQEGRTLPKSQGFPAPAATQDDHTDLLIRDASEPLQYGEIDTLTARQRRRLWESLQ